MNAHVYRHPLCPWIQLARARKAALDECWYPRLCLPLLQQPDSACVLRVSHVTEVLGLKPPSVQNAANRIAARAVKPP
jgi:hypothetical protein